MSADMDQPEIAVEYTIDALHGTIRRLTGRDLVGITLLQLIPEKD